MYDVVVIAFRSGCSGAALLETLFGLEPERAASVARALPSVVIAKTTRAHAQIAADQLAAHGADVRIVRHGDRAALLALGAVAATSLGTSSAAAQHAHGAHVAARALVEGRASAARAAVPAPAPSSAKAELSEVRGPAARDSRVEPAHDTHARPSASEDAAAPRSAADVSRGSELAHAGDHAHAHGAAGGAHDMARGPRASPAQAHVAPAHDLSRAPQLVREAPPQHASVAHDASHEFARGWDAGHAAPQQPAHVFARGLEPSKGADVAANQGSDAQIGHAHEPHALGLTGAREDSLARHDAFASHHAFGTASDLFGKASSAGPVTTDNFDAAWRDGPPLPYDVPAGKVGDAAGKAGASQATPARAVVDELLGELSFPGRPPLRGQPWQPEARTSDKKAELVKLGPRAAHAVRAAKLAASGLAVIAAVAVAKLVLDKRDEQQEARPARSSQSDEPSRKPGVPLMPDGKRAASVLVRYAPGALAGAVARILRENTEGVYRVRIDWDEPPREDWQCLMVEGRGSVGEKRMNAVLRTGEPLEYPEAVEKQLADHAESLGAAHGLPAANFRPVCLSTAELLALLHGAEVTASSEPAPESEP